MSAKRTDIEQIRKYLQGELEERAMHQLERKTQDDAFFAEAMEGFESAAPDQSVNYADLETRLANRITRKKERSLLLWRVLPLAACLLIALMVGYWYLAPKTANKQIAITVAKRIDTIKPDLRDQTNTVVNNQPPKEPKTAKINRKQEVVAFADAMAQPSPQSAANAEITVIEPVGNAEVVTRSPGYNAAPRDTSIFVRKSAIAKVDTALTGRVAGLQLRERGIPATSQYSTTPPVGIVTPEPMTDVRTQNAKKQAAAQVMIRGSRDSARNNMVNVNPGMQTVTGVVVSKDDGQPLPGVNVRIAGGNGGVLTDTNGKFTITVPLNSTLQVSYIGFQSTQVNSIANNNPLKIALEGSDRSLSEVVVVGYGTQRKRDVTGAVADVAAAPVGGQKAYDDYLKKEAIMPDGETGSVRVGFTVGADGRPQSAYVISGGRNKAMNEKAIEIIENGPRWNKGNTGKEVRLRIRFRKAKS